MLDTRQLKVSGSHRAISSYLASACFAPLTTIALALDEGNTGTFYADTNIFLYRCVHIIHIYIYKGSMEQMYWLLLRPLQ